MPDFKKCKSCGGVKEIFCFEKQRNVCRSCRKAYKKKYHSENIEKEAEYRRRFYKENKERLLADQKTPERKEQARIARGKPHRRLKAREDLREWRAGNKELCKEYDRKYAESRKDYFVQYAKDNKEKIKKYNRDYTRANKGKVNARTYRYRARKLNATPAWANHDLINAIYEEAAHRGLCVDHIIPLKGKFVCGFHCETNLQLLTAEENTRKGNSYAVS